MPVPSPTPDPTSVPPRTPPPPDPLVQPPVPAQPGECAESTPQEQAPPRPARQKRLRGRCLVRPGDAPLSPLTPEQRLLVLDAWRRSGLPAGDFAPLVGVSKHTLYAWKHKFETEGPAGLEERPRGSPTGSRLPR